MTIEQYGTGRYLARIATDDFVGTYRFGTANEAREFAARNPGAQLSRSCRETFASTLADLGAAADTRAGRRMS